MSAPAQTDRYKIYRSEYGAFRVAVTAPQHKMRGLARVAFCLLWFLVFTIAWENMVILPGIGTIGKLIGAIAFAAGALAIVDRGRLHKFAPLHGLMALFVIWGAFTYFWSTAPQRTSQEVVTYLQLLLMVWLIRELAWSKKLQQRLMGAYVLGTYVSAVCTFLAFRTGSSVDYNRYAAQGFNAGDLALMLVLSVPFSIYLSSVEQRKPLLWLYRLHPIAAIAGVFFTAARGGFIDMLISLLIVPLSFRRWRLQQKFMVSIAGLGAVIGALTLVPQSSWSRLGTIGQEVSTGTLNERTTIWRAGFEAFRSHPVEGVGVNAFAPTVQRSLGTPEQQRKAAANEIVEYVAHNTFVSVLVEEGLVGFTLFILILGGLWWGMTKLERPERNLWLIVLLVWTFGVMELTWEYRKPTWILFGLLSAAIASLRSEMALTGRQAPPRLR
jgi:O-antigen ligase